MADVATPSAAKMATADTSAPEGKQAPARPEKPDEDAFKEELAKAEKAHAAAQEKLKAVQAKTDLAGSNKDSPNAKRQAELKAQLNEIRQAQQGNKSSRSAVMERVKKLDEQLKARITEQKTARERLSLKTVADVDKRIASLQAEVDTGKMRLVDEKKALAEVSSLHKMRKSVAGLDALQTGIDEVKAKIAEEKKLMDNPEQKALSDRYTTLQTELDGLKAEQDEARKSLNTLRDQRTAARNEQQEKWTAMKEVKDKFYAQKRAFQEYDFQARKIRNERRRQEQAEYQTGKRKEAAKQRLEEASAPAYLDEILTAEGLIRYLDPSALPAKETTEPSKFAAATQRTVDDSGIKGTRIAKKDEESYFVGTGGKRGKKGKKGGATAATPSDAGLNINWQTISEFGKIGVDAPSSKADFPATIEKLNAKLAQWKKDQDRVTKENIAKAQKEIERLEAEGGDDDGTTDSARKPAQKNQGVNGSSSGTAELAQENDAEADVAEDLEKASLEDKADEPEEA